MEACSGLATAVLRDLMDRGVYVWPGKPGALECSVTITDELKALVSPHKEEILALLKTEEDVAVIYHRISRGWDLLEDMRERGKMNTREYQTTLYHFERLLMKYQVRCLKVAA